MENKINIARFKEGSRTAEVKDIWQWDYGQILRIQGLNLPTAVEIHFSLDEHGGEAARRIGVTKDGVTDVPIPDSMVENESAYGDSYYFFAYIYLADEESGNTEYKIRAKISTRSKPEGFVKPCEKELFYDAIEATRESLTGSKEAAELAEAWAHGREDYPDLVDDNAAYYANLAHDNATSTSKDKKSVEETADSVNNIAMRVNADKEESEQYRLQAAQSAAAALESENNSKASENASKKATEEAQIAEGQAELFAEQSENSADTAEQAKNLVMQIEREITENKEYVDKKVDDFNVLHQQAVQDIYNAGNNQVEFINSAGQKALENIGSGVDSTLSQEGKAADAKTTGEKIKSIEADLGNIKILDSDTGKKFHGTIKVSNGKPILEYDEIITE